MQAAVIPNGYHPQQQNFPPPIQNGDQISPAHSHNSLPGMAQQPPQYPHPPFYNNAPPMQFNGQPHGWYPNQPNMPYPGYQQFYPAPHQFNGAPYHPQMGGPGPATMQNGYGYPQNYTPRQPVGQFGPGRPHQPMPHANGHDHGNHPQYTQPPPPGEGHYNNPQHPPPQFVQHDFVPYQHGPHHMYPPNHPYANGNGFGYPVPVNNGPVYNHMPPAQHQPARPPQSKGLNPAALGFNFQPRQTEPAKSAPRPPVDNDTPMWASIAPPDPPRPPKAATEDKVAVENDHVAHEVPNGESQPAAGGLGLSQMDPAEASPVQSVEPVEPPEMDSKANTSSDSVETPVETPATVETDTVKYPTYPEVSPEAHDAYATPALSEKADDSTIMFTVPGLQSPWSLSVESTAVTSSDEASLVDPSRTTTVYAVGYRPVPDQLPGNAYSRKLTSRTSPFTVMAIEPTRDPVASRNYLHGSKRACVSMGNGHDTAMRITDPTMFFGKLSAEDIPAIVIGSGQHRDGFSEQSVQVVTVTPPSPAVALPLPPVAKVKPASWAALLGGGAKKVVANDTRSAGPSSVRVSPSKSVISLATETDLQTVADQTTPRSTAPSLPPVPAAPAASRPVFNYAAAAAAGKASPQDELVKLLTDGMRGRPKEQLAPNVPRGLINTGNMCFANTILQMLVYCAPFAELLEEFGKRLRADLARRTPLLEAIIVFLREFRPSGSGSSTPAEPAKTNGNVKGKGKDKKYTANDPFIPENVYDAMKENKRFDSMRRGHQEDAEEFLGFFLNTLHEELLYLVSKTGPPRAPSAQASQANDDAVEIQRPVSPLDGWLEVGKKQKTNVVRNTESRESAVSRIFGGTIRSVLRIPGQKDSITLEPYQPLQLDIQSPNVKSITDALRKSNEPDTLPGFWSDVRKEHVDVTKQVFLESLPPVLIVHLKRFVYDSSTQDVIKQNKPIAYSSELIIPSEIITPAKRPATPYKYRLFCVIYHHGSTASGGHYTVANARQDRKGWIHFDDETHSTLAEEDVMVSKEDAEAGKFSLVGGREKCAYLLFYQKVR